MHANRHVLGDVLPRHGCLQLVLGGGIPGIDALAVLGDLVLGRRG